MGQSTPSHALYIHWPWCRKKCPYCDFNSHVAVTLSEGAHEEAYIQTLVREMRHMSEVSKSLPLRSIFFGGGTPSLMAPKSVATLLEAAEKYFGFCSGIEITLEANPTSVELAKFKALASAGVNRLSVGMQSLEEEELKFLGREHTKGEAITAIEAALKAVDNVNLDLIYGLPNQHIEHWQKNLEALLTLGVHHISCYQLTIEKNTAFYADWRKGQLKPITAEVEALFYEATNSVLAQHGFMQYEISNCAKPGYNCIHNSHIWQYGSYIGLGAGAHGRYINQRGARVATRNYKMPQKYMDAALRGTHDYFEHTEIVPKEQVVEALLMGLRLKEGVSLSFLKTLYSKAYEEVLDLAGVKAMQENGFLHVNDTHLKATPEGFKLLNSVLEAIIR